MKLIALSDIRSTAPLSSLPPFSPTPSKFSSTHRQRGPANTPMDSACLAHLPRSWVLTCFTVPDSPAGPAPGLLANSQVLCSTWSPCWPTTLVQTLMSLTCPGVQLKVWEEALQARAHTEVHTQLVWVRDKHLSAPISWQQAHRLCPMALCQQPMQKPSLNSLTKSFLQQDLGAYTLFQPLQLEVKDSSSFQSLLLRPHLLQ